MMSRLSMIGRQAPSFLSFFALHCIAWPRPAMAPRNHTRSLIAMNKENQLLHLFKKGWGEGRGCN